MLFIAHVGTGAKRCEGIAAPADDEVGVVVVFFITKTVGALERDKAWDEAQVRCANHVIGAVPRIEFAERIADDVLYGCAVGVEKRLCAVLVFDCGQLFSDEGVRLIPADAFPVVASAFTHPYHGIFQAIGRIDDVDERLAFRAERTLR